MMSSAIHGDGQQRCDHGFTNAALTADYTNHFLDAAQVVGLLCKIVLLFRSVRAVHTARTTILLTSFAH
jgi:hypothetical protein